MSTVECFHEKTIVRQGQRGGLRELKLAALTPRPRINLVLYHGVLAPHSSWRAGVVAYGAPPAAVAVAVSSSSEASHESMTEPVGRHWAWADLMRRAFDIDVLACPRCGGRACG